MSTAPERPQAFEPRAPRWAFVCRMNDLLPGAGAAALLKGAPIAVFRLSDDRVFAIGNLDPCSNASVLSRGIVGDIDGAPVVASPIHKQHFRLEDGRCVEDPAVRVPSYRALIVDGGVVVQIPG
ncbi:MAG TPA: nitrite reductase small subunit NirD [Woeseiaceae bacterium]|jgi:nitrite reductase (NADH) small subunit|nr:nitrite reductase small subunit NirD [Woeseiaceae bacterium]